MKRGFTLIELLIVVAIIAILAAIAVPNFLEAQTRAKVSRVKADMRTIATAMESYVVDHNSYVNDSDNTPGKNGEDGLLRLTTPIAYMTTLAEDPFQAQIRNNVAQEGAKYFELGSGADNLGWPIGGGYTDPDDSDQTLGPAQAWLLISVGTDVNPATAADDTGNNDEFPQGKAGNDPTTLITYDATNGTISNGDIYRAGGAINTGNYFVNGQKFGPIN